MSDQPIISGLSHSFDTGIAKHLGLEEAVVYNHIAYWIEINRSKGKNIIDGKAWMYETFDEMTHYVPYLNRDRVRRAVENLIKHGLLIKANHNKNRFIKTPWYALGSDNSNIYKERQNCHIDEAQVPIEGAILPHRSGDIAPSSYIQVEKQVVNTLSQQATEADTLEKSEGDFQGFNSVKLEYKGPLTKRQEQEFYPGFPNIDSYVKLPQDDYDNFCSQHGKAIIDDLIDQMNDYCASTRQQGYSCYASALRQWIRKRKSVDGNKSSTRPSTDRSMKDSSGKAFKHPADDKF